MEIHLFAFYIQDFKPSTISYINGFLVLCTGILPSQNIHRVFKILKSVSLSLILVYLID